MRNEELVKVIKQNGYIPIFIKACEFSEINEQRNVLIKSDKRQSSKHPLIPSPKPSIVLL